MRRFTEGIISQQRSNKRKTFVSARRSSFLDLEATASALAESELKLCNTMKSLEVLEVQHKDLKAKYDLVVSQFMALKLHAINNVWCYCPEKSADFCHLPLMDTSVPELDNRLGDYDVCEIIGMGQFSTVKRGVRRSAPQCTERQGDKGQDRALMGAAIDADGMGAGAGTRAAQPVQVFGSGSNRLACTTCLAGSPFSGIADISSGDEAPVGTAVALKFLQKEKMTSIDTAIRVEAEIGALKALAGHANVVRYYTTVHARAAVCIVTELLQTDLFDFLARSKDKVSVPVAACIARELLEALCHLQEHCIAHRDVKPENILLDVSRSMLTVKLCDFNLCCRLPEHSSMLSHFVGSPGFFAPESITAARYCAYKADVFSLGCVLLEMVASAPFFLHHWMAAYKLVSTTEAPSFFPSIKRALQEAERDLRAAKNCDQDCLGLILHCLTLQPTLRLSAPRLRDLPVVRRASRVAAADALHDRVRRYIELPCAGRDDGRVGVELGDAGGAGAAQAMGEEKVGSRSGTHNNSRGSSRALERGRGVGSRGGGQFAMIAPAAVIIIPPFAPAPSQQPTVAAVQSLPALPPSPASPDEPLSTVPTQSPDPPPPRPKHHRATIAISGAILGGTRASGAFPMPFSPTLRSTSPPERKSGGGRFSAVCEGDAEEQADGEAVSVSAKRVLRAPPSTMLQLAACNLVAMRWATLRGTPPSLLSPIAAAEARAPHPAFVSADSGARRGSMTGARLLL